MAERYYITGVQLGILKSDELTSYGNRMRILKNIEEKQFIGRVESQKDKIIITTPKEDEAVKALKEISQRMKRLNELIETRLKK